MKEENKHNDLNKQAKATNPKRKALRVGSEGEEVREMQEALLKLGFYSGEEDMEFSSFSTGTQRAVKTWQATFGAPEDGIMTEELLNRLFLSRQVVARKKLQLVGVTAMLIACKYEEVSVPVVEDFIVISDRAYTREDVLQMERLMVNTLHFNLSAHTPSVFMQRFLKAAESNKKPNMESPFALHQQQLAMLAQQQFILMAAAAAQSAYQVKA